MALLHQGNVYLTSVLQVMIVKSESPRPGTREFAASDLRKLIGRSQEEEFKVEEDMPPLLQVRPHM